MQQTTKVTIMWSVAAAFVAAVISLAYSIDDIAKLRREVDMVEARRTLLEQEVNRLQGDVTRLRTGDRSIQ